VVHQAALVRESSMKGPCMSLKEQLAEYRAACHKRVPADRQAIMERHIEQLRNGVNARTMLKEGDHAPAIVLGNAKGEIVDITALRKKGPVIITFYRGGWCPYCNPRTQGVSGDPAGDQGSGRVASGN